MLVLIATNELQGLIAGDYAHAVDGELVTPLATECGNPGRCGCGRGFPGLGSSKATTTAMVVDRPDLTDIDLRDALAEWLRRGGWVDLFERSLLDDDELGVEEVRDEVADLIREIVDDHVEAIAQVCTVYPAGTILHRSGDRVMARSIPSAA